jgi:hypothetical protein
VKEPIEVIRQALPDSVVVVVTSLNIIFVGYDFGFKYASVNKTDNKSFYGAEITMDGEPFILNTDIIKE